MKEILPCLFLRELVPLPGNETHLCIGREFTLNMIKKSVELYNSSVFVITQIELECENPKPSEDLFSVGVKAKILKSSNFTDGTAKIFLKFEDRRSMSKYENKENTWYAEGEKLKAEDLKINNFIKRAEKLNTQLAKKLPEGQEFCTPSGEKDFYKFALRIQELISFIDNDCGITLEKFSNPFRNLSEEELKRKNNRIAKTQKLLSLNSNEERMAILEELVNFYE